MKKLQFIILKAQTNPEINNLKIHVYGTNEPVCLDVGQSLDIQKIVIKAGNYNAFYGI